MTDQGFPKLQAPFVDSSGSIIQPWLQLLISLWNRTGGTINKVISNLTANGTQGVTVDILATDTTTNITVGLGNITPTTVDALGTVLGSNLSGTNTGDQSLTGDVSGAVANPIITNINPNVVSYSKIQKVSSSVILGNPTGSLANISEISLTAPLAFSGSTLGLSSTTGTGTVVLQTSPTLITPVLGVATATSLDFSSTSGIIGTITNDNAAAGSVGEIIESSGSAISISNATATNITFLSLTAGDWDVWGNIGFNPAGTTAITGLIAALNTVTSALPSYPNNGAVQQIFGPFTTGTAQVISAGFRRYSLASTTTIYLISYANFSVSTMTSYGYIGARRVR